MQPSPRLETVRGLVVPRVRWVIVMSSTQRLGVRSKSRGLIDLALVDPDLVVDRARVPGPLAELGLAPLPVCLEQGEPFGLVAVAVAHEGGIASYVTHRHA